MRRSIGVGLAAVVLVTACTGGGGGSSPPESTAPDVTTAPTEEPVTTEPGAPTNTTDAADPSAPDPFLEAFARRLSAPSTGEPAPVPDLALAADLFEAAYGVDLGVGSEPIPGEVDTTVAARAILAHYEELDEAQRSQVDAALLVGTRVAVWDPATGSTRDLGPSDLRSRQGALPNCFAPGVSGRCTVGPNVQSMIDRIMAKYATLLGAPIGIPVWLAAGPSSPTVAADAVPTDASGNALAPGAAPGSCRVTLRVGAGEIEAGNARFETLLAHELFHCVQFSRGFVRGLDWLAEGGAEWAAQEVEGLTPGFSDPDSYSVRNYGQWFARTPNSLFVRGYDAVGFFETLEQFGVSPWRVFDSMFRAASGGHQAALGAAVPWQSEQERLARYIASTRVRQPVLGAAWELAGAPGTLPSVLPISLGSGASSPVTVPTIGLYGSLGVLVSPSGDVVTLKGRVGQGVVAFAGGPSTDLAGEVQRDWCIRPGGCVCPEGYRLEQELSQGAPGRMGIGLAEVPGRTGNPVDLVVATSTMADWCLQNACVVPGRTSAGPSRVAHAAAAVVPAQEPPECEPEPVPEDADPSVCAAGTWVSTSFDGPASPDEVSRSGGTGVRLTLSADGAYTLDFSGMVPYSATVTGPDHGELITTDVVFSGVLRGRWSVGDGALTTTGGDLSRVRIKSTLTVEGFTTTVLDKALSELGGGDGGAGVAGPLQCSGDRLDLRRNAPGAGLVGWVFSREG